MNAKSRGNSVGMAISYELDSRSSIPGLGMVILFTAFRTALVLKQPPIQ
jgi:hypothetical protein